MGSKTVEAIRYLQHVGKLHPEKDENGIFRFDDAELERVRSEREAEGLTPRLTSGELALMRSDRAAEMEEVRAHNALMEKLGREYDLGIRLRAEAHERDCAARAEFERVHMDQRTAAQALGIGVLERRARLEGLEGAGLLHPVPPPFGARIVCTEAGEPLRVEQGLSRMHVSGAPFYPKAEVLAVRHRMGLPQPRINPFEVSSAETFAGWLASFLKRA